MDFNKVDDFLKELGSKISYGPDRDQIKGEIKDHLLDKIDFYIAGGKSLEEAETLAVEAMGDPLEVGRLLNKEHNPVLGILYSLSNLLVGGLGLMLVIYLGISIFSSFLPADLGLDKDDIVYEQEVNQVRTIDNTRVKIKKIAITRDKSLHILYEKKLKYPLRLVWGNSYIGEISDDFGEVYLGGGYYSPGFFKSVGIIRLDDFNMESKNLLIDYDLYNRKYRITIPIEAGASYE